MINVLADQYLHNIESYLPKNINLTLFDPDEGFPRDIENTHALLVRTVFSVNKQTLPDIPEKLQFVGTASAGSDHVDIDYLNKHDITFTNAAGCNARSVAEYVATALILWSESREEELTDFEIGIVGVGHVGQQLTSLFDKLGISYEAYDPPREKRESTFSSATLSEVLSTDILTFHTPLTTEGNWPTYHWLDTKKLSQHAFDLVINTSRGGVIDELALLEAKRKGMVRDIIIDVWEDEPEFHLNTAEQAFIKTPHIAGYSEQAKNNATKIVVDAMLDYFDLNSPRKDEQQTKRTLKQDISHFGSFSDLLTELHPIKKYERELQNIIKNSPKQRGPLFNKLRAEYPLRQEFSNIYLPESYFDIFPILKQLGFSLLNPDAK